jgi:hypothetical protein
MGRLLLLTTVLMVLTGHDGAGQECSSQDLSCWNCEWPYSTCFGSPDPYFTIHLHSIEYSTIACTPAAGFTFCSQMAGCLGTQLEVSGYCFGEWTTTFDSACCGYN